MELSAAIKLFPWPWLWCILIFVSAAGYAMNRSRHIAFHYPCL